MFKKMTLPLLQLTKNCHLRFHVRLVDEEGNKESTFNKVYNNEYIHVDLSSFATLEIKEFGGGEWDRSKNILINRDNIYQLIKGVKKATKNIYKKGIFEKTVDGKTIIDEKTIVENTVDIFLGINQRVRISPAVIYDRQDDCEYEGFILYINRTSNFVEMHFTKLESLLYNLKKIDFNVYADMLLKLYLDHIKTGRILPNHISFSRDIFSDEVNVTEEKVEGRTVQRVVPDMDSFFN